MVPEELPAGTESACSSGHLLGAPGHPLSDVSGDRPGVLRALATVSPPCVSAVGDTAHVTWYDWPPSQSPDSGPAPSGGTKKRPRARWVFMVVAVLTVALTTGVAIHVVLQKAGSIAELATKQTTPPDADRDGLPDEVEQAGWTTDLGTEYRTDPRVADTDGDGLTDGDEAGALTGWSAERSEDDDAAEAAPALESGTYSGYSDPLASDSDGDALGDAHEADLGLDPLDSDSDDDDLKDGPEVEVVGTDPETVDTDGDGFADGFEQANKESQGLNPLWVDIKVSKTDHVVDFAKGAVLGDLDREDSLAWLAGNLTSGASSTVPVVGWVVGGVADVRDAIGSAIHADWVGSGFSAAGVLPYGGDAVAIPGKAAKFVLRNPELAAAVAAAIVAISKVPNSIKVEASKQIFKGWDDLRSAGASERALLRLETGRINLDHLAIAMKRPSHVPGDSTGIFAKWQDGEAWVATKYGAGTRGVDEQVRFPTAGCGAICASNVRIADTFVDGVAHESKVGYTYWSQSIEREIRKDAWLVGSGEIESAHWHFFASGTSNTIGASPKVLDRLDAEGIAYTIHPPV